MDSRRSFLKMLSMAAVATTLPLPRIKPEKLVIKSDGYAGIGVGGVERMRIYSNGNVGFADTSPNTKLDIFRI